MSSAKKAIVWFRQDLRLQDNPALHAALQGGYEPVPVFIDAPDELAPWTRGAASSAWLHHSLNSLSADLARLGSRLVLRKGPSDQAMTELLKQSGARAVFYNRSYEPQARARDAAINELLSSSGVDVQSFNANLFCEPEAIHTQSDTPYKVFTPFWRKLRPTLIDHEPMRMPAQLPGVDAAISGVELASLGLLPEKNWDQTFWEFWQPGEAGAQDLLESFIDGALISYSEQRNLPDRIGTSKLSPHLHFGELSVWQIFRALQNLPKRAGLDAAKEHYLRELGWREFSAHLLYHFPHTHQANLNPKFDGFDWRVADESDLGAWQRGHTGIPIVDAGMRELWQTGWMHNRVRMIVASFLCKNLRYHWLHGARWFWGTLLDADLANNTQGWQWTAGTGADAAPYFRIFNPVTQAKRFDPKAAYIKRWVPELEALDVPAVFAPWEHPDQAQKIAGNYPRSPLVDLSQSRNAALSALKTCA